MTVGLFPGDHGGHDGSCPAFFCATASPSTTLNWPPITPNSNTCRIRVDADAAAASSLAISSDGVGARRQGQLVVQDVAEVVVILSQATPAQVYSRQLDREGAECQHQPLPVR